MQKDIQLVGIGNALVDIQFEVSDSELESMQLEKGTMTLVDREKQLKLMEFLGNRTHHKSSGGSAANTLIAFSSFGGKAAYKSMVGNDAFGSFYIDEFRNLGIILDAKIHELEHTGLCFVFISPDSERTMATALGATAHHGIEHLNDELIKRAEWLYIEGYRFTEKNGADAINHAINVAKKYNTKIAVTFSDKFVIDFFRSNLEFAIENADLLFCNEMEAIAYTQTPTVEDAFVSLIEGNKNFILTKGGEGSLVHFNNEVFEIPSFPVKAIDSTGAGDMYAAGFLYGLIHWESPLRAGYLGSYAASKVVSQLGARLNESHTDIRNYIHQLDID